MPTAGPSPGLLIVVLVLSLIVGAGAGWVARKARWWLPLLLATLAAGGGTAIAGGLTYSAPDQTPGRAAVDRLAAAGLITAGVIVGVTALLVSWFVCHRSVRRAAVTAQRRRTGGTALQPRRRPPVAVRARSGYIPRGAVVHREKP